MTTTIVLGVILFIVFVWFIYYAILVGKNKRQLKKLKKNYDGKEDFSKQGEENRRRLLREGGSSDKGKPSLKQFVQPERRRVLQTASTDKSRKDSVSRGKTSTSPREIPRRTTRTRRGIFRRLRKK